MQFTVTDMQPTVKTDQALASEGLMAQRQNALECTFGQALILSLMTLSCQMTNLPGPALSVTTSVNSEGKFEMYKRKTSRVHQKVQSGINISKIKTYPSFQEACALHNTRGDVCHQSCA